MRADRLAPHGHGRKELNMQTVRTALHLNICYLKRLAKSQKSVALGDSGAAASEHVAECVLSHLPSFECPLLYDSILPRILPGCTLKCQLCVHSLGVTMRDSCFSSESQ